MQFVLCKKKVAFIEKVTVNSFDYVLKANKGSKI